MVRRVLTAGVAAWSALTVLAFVLLPTLSTYDLAGEVPDADTDRLLTWFAPVTAVALLPGVVIAATLAQRYAAQIVEDARRGHPGEDRLVSVTPNPRGGWWRWGLPTVGASLVVLVVRALADDGLAVREALLLGVLVFALQASVACLVVLVGMFVGMPLRMLALAAHRRSTLGRRATSAVLSLALMVVLIPVVGVALQLAFSGTQSGGTPRGRAVGRIIEVLVLAPSTPSVVTARVLTLALVVVTVFGVLQLRPDRSGKPADQGAVTSDRGEPQP